MFSLDGRSTDFVYPLLQPAENNGSLFKANNAYFWGVIKIVS